jgi:hypothetical protein
LEHSAVGVTVFGFFVYAVENLSVYILAQLFDFIFKLHNDVSLMLLFNLEEVDAHEMLNEYFDMVF